MTWCGGENVEQEFVLDASTDAEDVLPAKPLLSVLRSRESLLPSNKLAEIQAPHEIRSKITWRPAIDVFFDRKDSTLVLLVDLPGFTKEEISVEVGEGHLYLSGPRSRNELREKYGANLVLSVHERPTGFFYRVFQLPCNAVEESVHAVFINAIYLPNWTLLLFLQLFDQMTKTCLSVKNGGDTAEAAINECTGCGDLGLSCLLEVRMKCLQTQELRKVDVSPGDKRPPEEAKKK